MKDREADKAAGQGRLARNRGRRALLALLRKRRTPTSEANAPAALPPIEGRGPIAISVKTVVDDVTWRSKVF